MITNTKIRFSNDILVVVNLENMESTIKRANNQVKNTGYKYIQAIKN